jgi:hypothetical protein
VGQYLKSALVMPVLPRSLFCAHRNTRQVARGGNGFEGHQHVNAWRGAATEAVILLHLHGQCGQPNLSVAEEEILHDRHVLVHGQRLVLVLREALPLRGKMAVRVEFWVARPWESLHFHKIAHGDVERGKNMQDTQ